MPKNRGVQWRFLLCDLKSRGSKFALLSLVFLTPNWSYSCLLFYSRTSSTFDTFCMHSGVLTNNFKLSFEKKAECLFFCRKKKIWQPQVLGLSNINKNETFLRGWLKNCNLESLFTIILYKKTYPINSVHINSESWFSYFFQSIAITSGSSSLL